MKVLSYLIIIFSAPLLILLIFHFLIFNKLFYKYEFKKHNIYQNFQNKQTADDLNSQILNYFCCESNLETDLLNDNEKIHLADVKVLLIQAKVYYLLLSTFTVFSLILFFYKKEKRLIIATLKWASAITFLSIIFLSLGIKINFEKNFTVMHVVLFENNLWQLPPESNLIKLYPSMFFYDFANFIGVFVLIISLLIFIITLFLETHKFAKKL